MVLDVLLISIAMVGLIIASYCDIRTREVPDWLNFGLIFSVLGIRLIFSVGESWNIFISGLLGFAIFFVLAYLFYYTNQWGGGDSKLLMAMGLLIGVTFPFNSSSWNLFWFFLILLFLGAVYGLVWMFILAIQKWSVFFPDFKKNVRGSTKVHYAAIIGSLLLIIAGLFYHFFFILAVFPVSFFYLFMFVTAVEECCFLKKVKISKLTEGDWLAEDVLVKGKKLLDVKTLEKNDLKKLRELMAAGKLKHVLIKEGVPFIPSFLFAYISLTFGSKFISWFFQLIFT